MSLFKTSLRFTSLGLALASGGALVAQVTTGGLAGCVRDQAGRPLAEAKVILSSPVLFQPRVILTNADGEWRAALLPVGNYRVQATRDGFVGAEATNVRVGIGTSFRQDLMLKAAKQAAAVVEVVGEAADVDKAGTKTSTNLSSETLDTLAGANRSFAGAADLTVGVSTAGNGGFSVRGGATQNTLYRVNGTDIKDDLQGSQVGTWVIQDNIVDVQVVLSPLNARNGRALGGQVNVVTKTGGNAFEGSFRAHLGRPAWNAATAYNKYTPGETGDTMGRTYDVTASGPIIKDRLWFSVGTILKPKSSSPGETGPSNPLAQGPMRTNDPAIDSVVAAPPSGYAFASFLTQTQYYVEGRSSDYLEGKLTGALLEGHTLEASFVKSGNEITNRNPGVSVRRVEALGTQTGDQAAWGLNYRAVLGADKFVEARYNRYKSKAVFPTGDPKFSSDAVDVWYDAVYPNPHNLYQIGYPFGLGITPRPDERNNTSWNVNLGMFKDLGSTHHEMDFGAEFYQFDRNTTTQAGADNRSFRVGAAYYNAASQDWLFPAIIWPYYASKGQSSSGNTGLAPVMFQNYGQDGITKNSTLSFYANDSITLDRHWNVMLGLRYDQIKVIDTTGATLAKASDWSPRLQVRYDLKGDSRHVLTLTAARFQGDFTSGFTSAFVTTAAAKSVSYGFSGLAGQPNPWANPSGAVRWLTYAQLTDPRNYTGAISDIGYGTSTAYAFYDNSKTYQVDAGLRAPHMDELSLGYRRGFQDGNYIKVCYVFRLWKKEWGFSTDYAADQLAVVSDPTGNGLPDKLMNTVHIFNSDALKRRYQGFELEYFRKLSGSFNVQGNYTYGRLTGNNNGGDSPLSTFRDNGVPGYYNNRRYLTGTLGLTDNDIAPDGPLAADQTHRVRLSLTYEMPLDKGKLSYSALVRYDSGNNWSATSPVPLGQDAYDFYNKYGMSALLPGESGMANIPNAAAHAPTTYTKYYGGRGQYTFNDVIQVDLKVSWRMPLGYQTLQLIGDLQVSNLLNQMAQLAYSTGRAPLTYGGNHLFLNTTSNGTFGGANPQEGNYWNAGRSVAASVGMRF